MTVVQPGRDYRELLERHALASVDAILGLPAVVVGCHPNRSVARLRIGEGPDVVRAFLKRERRGSWKERLASWWAGLGYVSKSFREAELLRQLREAGVSCPEVIACGGDGCGGAFLLLREMNGFVELRSFLADQRSRPVERRRFARALGAALARIHGAGFDHPDLYSKHVLVHPRARAIGFVDWQRSRRRRSVSWARRYRDLAALDATLGDEFASARERLACLRAYLVACGASPCRLRAVAGRIRRLSERLQRKRRVRELRQPALPTGEQLLVALQGDTLYAAPDLPGEIGAELRGPLGYAGIPQGASDYFERIDVKLESDGEAILTRRRVHRPRGWFWAWLRGRALISPERQQADSLYRLQRYGVLAPRLLAYGQRQVLPWQRESLILLEPPADTVALDAWLAGCPDAAERRRVRGQAEELLRRMHAAGHYFGLAAAHAQHLRVQASDSNRVRVVLGSIDGLLVRRTPSARLAEQDRAALRSLFANVGTTEVRADLLACGVAG